MRNDTQIYLRCADCGAIVNSSEEAAHRCPKKPQSQSGAVDIDGVQLCVGDHVIVSVKKYIPAIGRRHRLHHAKVYSLGEKMATLTTDVCHPGLPWDERAYYHAILKQ